MKKILFLLSFIICAYGLTFAENAIVDDNYNASMLGDYNGVTKRLKLNNDGSLNVGVSSITATINMSSGTIITTQALLAFGTIDYNLVVSSSTYSTIVSSSTRIEIEIQNLSEYDLYFKLTDSIDIDTTGRTIAPSLTYTQDEKYRGAIYLKSKDGNPSLDVRIGIKYR